LLRTLSLRGQPHLLPCRQCQGREYQTADQHTRATYPPVVAAPQLDQEYFKLLGFAPAAIPSLAFEEAVAEKIRAASQRSKSRDLHDLSEIAGRKLNRELIRSLAVLKLCNSGGPGLDYDRFSERINGGGDYDVGDLANLLRKDQKPDLDGMIRRVLDGFRFIADLTDAEKTLVANNEKKNRKEADALVATLEEVPA
jgi:hypothetical protein